jgi:membrane-associated phospholipid phosphatase
MVDLQFNLLIFVTDRNDEVKGKWITEMERQTILPAIRSNFYVLAVLGYSLLLVFYYIRSGVLFQFDLGLIALVILPIILFVLQRTKKSDQRLFLREWVPLIVILLSYEALQGMAGSTSNILNLFPYDKMLWSINLTGTIQQIFYSKLVTDITLMFYSLHFYLVIVASVVLWLFRRPLFSRYAVAITITSYVSLLVFALYPTAPPWYSGAACNLVNLVSPCSLSATTGISAAGSAPPVISQLVHINNLVESDKFAAFPSLHAAYITLFCAFMVKFKRKLIFAMIPLEFGVLFATLYLGQHYVIDLIAGVSLALVSVVLSDVIVKKYNPFSRAANEEPQQFRSQQQGPSKTQTTNT